MKDKSPEDLIIHCGKRPPYALQCYENAGTGRYHFCRYSSVPRDIEQCLRLYAESFQPIPVKIHLFRERKEKR